MYATQPILPLLSKDFHVGPTAAGTSVSVVVAAIALGSGLFGPLSDVWGRKRVLVVSAVLLAAATLACAFASSFEALLLFRGLQGLAAPGVSAVAVAYLGDRFGRANVGSIVGTYIACTGLGGLLGRVISGVLASAFDWRATFYAYAGFTIIAAIAMWLTLDADHAHAAGRERPLGAAYAAMARHLRDPRLAGAFGVGAMLFFAFIGIFTYLPYLLSGARFQLSTGTISAFYLSYLAGIFISPLSGRLSQRIPPRTLMMAGIGIAAAGCAVTLLPSLAAIATGTVVLCTGMFTVQAIAPAYVNATASQAKGAASSLYQTFYYGGAMLGSTLPGIGWERFAWPGVIAACIVSLGAAFGATALLDARAIYAAAPEPLPDVSI